MPRVDYLLLAEQALKVYHMRLQEQYPVGAWIEFDSPIFGCCRGRVVEVIRNYILVDRHSVIAGPVLIPAVWVRGVAAI